MKVKNEQVPQGRSGAWKTIEINERETIMALCYVMRDFRLLDVCSRVPVAEQFYAQMMGLDECYDIDPRRGMQG